MMLSLTESDASLLLTQMSTVDTSLEQFPMDMEDGVSVIPTSNTARLVAKMRYAEICQNTEIRPKGQSFHELLPLR